VIITFHADAEDERDSIEGFDFAPYVQESEEKAIGDEVKVDKTGEERHHAEEVYQ
jgi:hypothetical protein